MDPVFNHYLNQSCCFHRIICHHLHCLHGFCTQPKCIHHGFLQFSQNLTQMNDKNIDNCDLWQGVAYLMLHTIYIQWLQRSIIIYHCKNAWNLGEGVTFYEVGGCCWLFFRTWGGGGDFFQTWIIDLFLGYMYFINTLHSVLLAITLYVWQLWIIMTSYHWAIVDNLVISSVFLTEVANVQFRVLPTE